MSGINVPVTFSGDFQSILNGLGGALSKGASGLGKIGTAAGESYSSGLLGRLKDRMVADGQYAIQALGGVLKSGAAVAGAAVTGLLTAAFTKGFSRLTALDDAEAKLRGFGHSAETITVIMQNARAAVDGTAHGMGDAATAAAGAIAAGIAPGRELERTLTAVANTSSATGRSMVDMGALFNAVANNSRATNYELKQLANAGIDIYGALSKVMGVAKEDVFELAREGKVSFEQFQEAAEIATGNVAKEMGTTFRGSLDNVGAAIGRVGAEFLKPVFKQMAPLFMTISASLKPLEDAAARLGESFGRVFEVITDGLSGSLKIGELSGPLGAVGDAAVRIRDAFIAVGDVVGPFLSSLSGGQQAALAIGGVAGSLAAIMPMLSSLPVIGGAFSAVVPSLAQIGGLLKFATGPLGILIGLLVSAYATSDRFRDAVANLFKAILPLGKTLIDTLVPAISQLGPMFGKVVDAVTPFLTVVVEVAGTLVSMLVPVLQQLIETVVPILMTVIGALIDVFAAIMPVITAVVESIAGILFPVLEAIIPIVSAVISAVGDIFGSIVEVVRGWINLLKAVFTGDWAGAWQALKDLAMAGIELLGTLFTALWDVGVNLITGLIDGVLSMISGVWDAISNIGSAIIDGFKSLLGIASPSTVFLQFGIDIITGLINGIKSMFGAITSAISAVPGLLIRGLGNVGSALLSSGVNFVGGLVSGVRSAYGRVTSAAKEIPGKIKGALGNVGSFLKSSGSALMSGLADGIKGALGKVTGAAKDALGKVRNLFPFSPAKEGPFSGRGWTLYSGESISEALAQGIRNQGYDVVREAESVARQAALAFAQVETDPVLSRDYSLGSYGAAPRDVSSSNEYYSYGDIEISLSMESIREIEDLEALLRILRQARADSRRTRRSGRVLN